MGLSWKGEPLTIAILMESSTAIPPLSPFLHSQDYFKNSKDRLAE
jgi:hypothetical protein